MIREATPAEVRAYARRGVEAPVEDVLTLLEVEA